MGHVISIGNAAPCWPDPGMPESPYFDIAKIDGAALGAPIDSCGATPPTHMNTICPGYIAWDDFITRTSMRSIMKEWGLDLWPAKGGSLCVVMLCKDHVEMFRAVRDRTSKGFNPEPYDLIRLDWLIWWTDWALANCEHPAISSWGSR